MKARILICLVLLALASVSPGRATATAFVPNFVGHNCTISTCRYFTSSYHTARYYYDRRTCSQWKSLSRKYLRGYNTVRRLHRDFPHRTLHPPCQAALLYPHTTMYGLPEDLDLSFFVGTTLIQLGMGEHQIAFVLHPDVRLSVGSRMRVTNPDGETVAIDEDYRETAGVLLLLISHDVQTASRTPSGALRLEWSNGAALEVDDDTDHYESYTINHGDRLIVVQSGGSAVVDELDMGLTRAWGIFLDYLSDETDEELDALLPPLVAAGFVLIDGQTSSGYFWRFTPAGVQRAAALGLD